MSVLSFSVDDVDQARAIGARLFYDRQLLLHGGVAPFRYDVTVGRLGTVVAAVFSYGCEVTVNVAAADMAYGVCVPLDDAISFRVADVDIVADPSSAVVMRPEVDVAARGWRNGGEQAFLMTFEPFALEAALGRMLGREVSGPIQFSLGLDLRSGHGAQWWRLARVVAAALAFPDGLAWNPIVAAPLSSTLTASLLLAADHQYRELLDAPHKPVPPPVIRRALSIIDERAHEPLTVTGIAAEVGCNVRALQAGFAKHVGTSPSQRLAKIRMDRVHQELVVANPESSSVGSIASKWGFTHLGRFAAAYRRIYGVTPSRTLRGG